MADLKKDDKVEQTAKVEQAVTNKAAHALRDLDDEELLTKLREAKEELFNLRFQAATGQLESHGRLRAIKKEIARIYTTMRERELGITTVEGVA